MERTKTYQLYKPGASDYIDPTPFNDNADIIDAELAKRALAANLTAHAGNAGIHVTAAQKTKWNGYETVHTLTHSRSAPGRFHALTGLNGATGVLSCQFKATAAFAAGDTVKVDGTAYTVKLQDGKAAKAGLFVSGALVSCIIDTTGKTVNFKAGGGYAEGDVIAAGKVEVVYDPESLDFITYAILGKALPSVSNTLYVNPQGTRAYVDSGSYLSTYSMDGTKIAQKFITLSGQPAFDDQGNLYSIATEDSSDYYLYQFKADGTAKQLKYVQSYSVVFWANSRINVNDFSTLYQYSSAGTQVGKFTLPDSSIKAGCQGDGTAIYVVSSSKLYKLTSTGTQTWAASLSPSGGSYGYGLAYHDGYVYLMDGNRSSKIQRYTSAGSKDSSWSSVYASSGGSLSVATFGTKKYLKLYYNSWDSYLIQFSSGQTALALTDSVVGNSYSIADDVGAVYYNWRGNLMRLYPAATGYKILEG